MRRQSSPLIDGGWIPLDVSWTIRMGVLDLVNKTQGRIKEVLGKQKVLPDELQKLHHVVKQWGNDEVIVDSEYLYKCLTVANFEDVVDVRLAKGANLEKIDFHESDFEGLTLGQLMKMPSRDDEWVEGYILANGLEHCKYEGNRTLGSACETVRHWNNRVFKKKSNWMVYYDDTIFRQAENFASLTGSARLKFHIRYAEDYPFARAFDIVKPYQVPGRLSQYKQYTEEALVQYDSGEVTSDNGRVVQAMAMKSAFFGDKVKFKNPDAATENWPQFWQFLKAYS